jgi:hypothetical protein
VVPKSSTHVHTYAREQINLGHILKYKLSLFEFNLAKTCNILPWIGYIRPERKEIGKRNKHYMLFL